MPNEMDIHRQPAVSFIVRCWPEHAIDAWSWWGEVEHVPSGQRRPFRNKEQMSSFLQDLMDRVVKYRIESHE